MKGLKRKNAIITGSTRGIGRAIAERLASEGANIVISSSSSGSSPEIAEEIARKYNVKTLNIQANVTKFEEVENLVTSAKEFLGSVDILVNNAGITRDNLILRMNPDDFDLILDIHIKGVFYGTKAVYPIMMKQRSGKIINISSVVGIMGNAGQANYAAAKAGIIGLTKSTAKELAGRGINVNAIAPGFIGTDMTDTLPEAEKNKILTAIPMKRMGKTEEVAALAAFLASEESNYINGQVISICGGMVM